MRCAPPDCLTGKSGTLLSSPDRKNIPLYALVEASLEAPPSRPTQRGVSRSSRTLARDAVDAAACLTKRAERGRRNRVVLTPRRRRQVGGSNSAGDGDNKARSPGRVRRKPLKPLRGECRAAPVNLW